LIGGLSWGHKLRRNPSQTEEYDEVLSRNEANSDFGGYCTKKMCYKLVLRVRPMCRANLCAGGLYSARNEGYNIQTEQLSDVGHEQTTFGTCSLNTLTNLFIETFVGNRNFV